MSEERNWANGRRGEYTQELYQIRAVCEEIRKYGQKQHSLRDNKTDLNPGLTTCPKHSALK